MKAFPFRLSKVRQIATSAPVKFKAIIARLASAANAAGKLAMSPMPQFRLRHEDALAVVTCLRPLKHRKIL
jgi:hypothetical protein